MRIPAVLCRRATWAAGIRGSPRHWDPPRRPYRDHRTGAGGLQQVCQPCTPPEDRLPVSAPILVSQCALSLKNGCGIYRDGQATAHLTVGSVKSCYGHTEGTAGLTGSLLVVQSLVHQVRLQPCDVAVCQGTPMLVDDVEQDVSISASLQPLQPTLL